METHKTLDPIIDASLIKNLLNSELKRQLLSFIFLIHDELFSYANILRDQAKNVKDLIEIYDLEKTEQSEKIELLDKQILETLWRFHLFEETKKDTLEKYLNSMSMKNLRDLFTFFKDGNGNLIRYYFYPEELANVLSSFFKEWKQKKILLKQQVFELENVRCRKYPIIHNVLNNHNIDGDDLILFPENTYEVIREMNLIYEPLFFAEYYLHQIIDNIDGDLSTIKSLLVRIFPYYFDNARKFDGIVKTLLKENENINIIQQIIDNGDDYNEELVELVSSDTYSEYHQEYILALDKIFKLNWEFRRIKEKAEKEYQKCFSDNSKIE
ncbi:MAG: hypothetical protein DRO88_06495, partial [Promethearchaeia archaeon]